MAKKIKTALAQLVADVTDNVDELNDDDNEKHKIKRKQASWVNNDLDYFSQQSDHADKIVFLPTESCYLWEFADRPDDELGDIQSLADSIAGVGQQEPILVRPKLNKTYEIIFGNRRWRACKLIGKEVLAIIKTISDKDAARIQKEENENRKDISDYSKAISYKKMIDNGLFNTELELSQSLNISPQTLNDIFSYNRVPYEIASNIDGFKFLPRKLVVKLARFAKLTKYQQALINLADSISSKKINSSNLESYLKKYLDKNVLEGQQNNNVKVVNFKNSDKEAIKMKLLANGKINISISNRLLNDDISMNKLIENLKAFYELG